MGIFDKFFNGNTTNNNNEVSINMSNVTSSFVKGNNYARESEETTTLSFDSIDEDTAMKIGALYQGVNIIGDTIASLPCYLYKETDGFQEVFYRDPRSRVLSTMANETLTAFNFKKAIIKDLILHGNAYAKIEKTGKDVMLRYFPVDVVTTKKDEGGYYFEIQSYSTDISGERYPSEIIDFSEMFVVTKNNQYNSLEGKGLLDFANDVFAMSIEETKYMYGLLANGLSAKAILSSSTPFRKEIKEQLKRDLKSFYSGANNAGKIMLLEGDVNVVPLSLTPTDLKLIENQHFTISQISRFLNIPKHLLNLDRQQGTYSNITQERLQLLTNTLMPYVTIIEQAMNQKLLEPNEIEQGYYFAFDTSELMKMTPEDQADYILKLWDADVITIEEVRANLSLGGDAETIAQLKLIQQAKTNMTLNELNTNSQENTPQENMENKPTDEPVDKNKEVETSEEVQK